MDKDKLLSALTALWTTISTLPADDTSPLRHVQALGLAVDAEDTASVEVRVLDTVSEGEVAQLHASVYERLRALTENEDLEVTVLTVDDEELAGASLHELTEEIGDKLAAALEAVKELGGVEEQLAVNCEWAPNASAEPGSAAVLLVVREDFRQLYEHAGHMLLEQLEARCPGYTFAFSYHQGLNQESGA